MELSSFYKEILGLELPWVIEKVSVSSETKDVVINISNIVGRKLGCKECGNLCSVYDHTPIRIWRHLDTCDYETHIHCRVPRTSCENCGIHRVKVPWSRPYSKFTLLFESHIIKVLQNTQVLTRSAEQLGISVDELRQIRNKAVERGQNRQSEERKIYKVSHLCIDEKSLFRGHHYVTIFYDGQTGRVLDVVEHRTRAATEEGFKQLENIIDLSEIEVVTMDMWEAFRSATESCVPQAAIVHDRFHIAQHINNAVDIVRRAENKKLVKQEDNRLKGTKYIWLKDPKNLTEKQQVILDELVKDKQLSTVQGWELKESLKDFFQCENKDKALFFFKSWKNKVEQSCMKPLIKVANMIENNLERMLNYFEYKVSNAMAESRNSSIQQVKMKARGFRSAKSFRRAILFYCGQLDLLP